MHLHSQVRESARGSVAGVEMSRRWRVAVLGLGHWYSAYGLARSLREYPRAELVAVACDDDAQLNEFMTTFGVKGYADHRQLLEREQVDIVQIASPVAQIPELAIDSARSGKHIVLGKPMAMTVEEADRMVDEIDRAGVVCFPFQGIMRLRAAELKKRIEEGTIGELILLHQTCRWSIAEDWYTSGRPGWFADPRRVPGGAFIDEGIYWIDFFRWMTSSEVIQVEARMANLVHKDIAVEDWGMASFTFANGVFATLEASWTIVAPRASGPSPKQNSVVRSEIVGTRGEIIDQWFRMPGRAVLAAGARDWAFERQSEEPYAPPAPFPLGHLIDCVENDRQPVATIHDARKSFGIAIDTYRAAREGRRVLMAS
jgi:predicted dehydrogenase